MEQELTELYRTLSKIQKRKLQVALKDFNLYVGQPSILHCILRHEKMTLTQLVREMNNSKESLSVSVKRLEKSGLVHRFPDADDGRVNWISLTQQGKDMAQLCYQNYMVTSAHMFDCLDQNEKKALKILLEKMIVGLKGDERGIL